MSTRLYTETRATVTVGAALNREGGEGTIHRVEGDQFAVAKIYHVSRLVPELEEKVKAMAARPPKDPTWEGQHHRSIAWVQHVLYRDANRKQFVGFAMPFIDTKLFREAHAYFDPRDRTATLGGNFTWRHLVTAAQNLSSCVAAIHEQKHRVGDLRERNILIAPNALVCLVDCDSFQIADPTTGRTFPTRVGTGEYLPPELQDADFGKQNIDRYTSDLFALAVLIFKFLMQGVHPFQARGPAVQHASSTEAKIKLGCFPYEGGRGVLPPVFAPSYSLLPKGVRAMFRECFVGGQRDPKRRPSAEAWFRELRRVGAELRHCKRNENHWFAAGTSCPWCEMLKQGNPDPFPASQPGHQVAAATGGGSAASGNNARDYLLSFLEIALADGQFTPEEEKHIKRIGLQVGFSERDTEKLIAKELAKRPLVRTGHSARVTTAPPATPAPPRGGLAAPKPPKAAVTPPAPPRGMPTPILLGFAALAVTAYVPYRIGRASAQLLGIHSTGKIVAPVLANCGGPFKASALSQWSFGSLVALIAAIGLTLVVHLARRGRTRLSAATYVILAILLAGAFGTAKWLVPAGIRSDQNFFARGVDLHWAKGKPAVCAFAGDRVAWTRENFGSRWAYNSQASTIAAVRAAPGEPARTPRLVSGFRLVDGTRAWQHVVLKPYRLNLNLYATERAHYAYAVINVLRPTGTTVETDRLSFRSGRLRGGKPLKSRYWRRY